MAIASVSCDFGTDAAEAHRAGAKSLDDLAWPVALRPDGIESAASSLKSEQTAQRASCSIVVVDCVGELPVGVLVVVASGNLQSRKSTAGSKRAFRLRPANGIHPGWAVTAAGRRHRIGITQGVATQRFFGKHVERDALDAAGRSDKALVDDFVLQAQVLRKSVHPCSFAAC